MLKDRIVNTCLGSVKVRILVTKGCPQGGILPPLIYCMVKDSLLNLLNDNGYFAQGFADDLALLIIGKFISVLCSLMQSALELVEQWCSANEQIANPDKTKLILFTKKRLVNGFSPPKFFGKEIHLSGWVKYLGLIIDSMLKWELHLKTMIQKAITGLWQCRRTIGLNWGLKPKVVLWIYTAIIRPRMAYASLIWWKKCQIGTVQAKLAKVQRLALIGVTGAMKSTPSAGIEAMLCLEPLHLFIEVSARCTFLRLSHSNYIEKVNYGHSSLWNQMTKEIPELEMPVDKIAPTYKFDRRFRIIIPSRTDWMNNAVTTPPNSYTFFTDGSRCNELSGAGIHLPQLNCNLSLSLGKYATVSQSEIVGLSNCDLIELSLNNDQKPVFIFSDSQSSLKALGRYKFVSALLVDCFNVLQQIASIRPVTVLWVPGHTGITGNEKADDLARSGSKETFIGPEPCIPVSTSIQFHMIKNWKKERFMNHWQSLNTARQARISITPNLNNAKYYLSLSRHNLKRLTEVLTGHNKLNKHLHTMGLTASPNCNECDDPETSEHFLCKCPAYIMQRAKILGAYILPYRSIHSLAPSAILKFMNDTKRI